MQLNAWWMSPEYDRKQPMNFPEGGGRMRRVGKDVAFRDGRWQSTPIRVYVGPSFR